MRRGYAVLDFETTGFSPKTGDRIIEVGAVYLDPDLRIEGGIETLINPQRDVGPTRVHGITARDVFDAPTFDEVAPELIDLLDGRVVVGHNVSFDLRFLTAELQREGYELPEVVTIDTVEVARSLLTRSAPPNFKLHTLAAHLGIELEAVCRFMGIEARSEHSALGDALVTAFVLSHFAGATQQQAFWGRRLDLAEAVVWPERVRREVTPKRRGEPLGARGNAEQDGPVAAAAGEIIRAVAMTPGGGAETASYSALLESSLSDGALDVEEVDRLIERAVALGLDAATLGSLHRGYFDAVVQAAWADGVLDPEEEAEIRGLAQVLGIDPDSLKSAVRADAEPARFEPGTIVVLTGEMSRERALVEEELVALGCVVGANVTKKTGLVIAADPYTLSGKARKARDYGIPVLGEAEGFSILRGC